MGFVKFFHNYLLSHFGRVKTLAFQPTASAEVSEA
jgi:hypothetical protein